MKRIAICLLILITLTGCSKSIYTDYETPYAAQVGEGYRFLRSDLKQIEDIKTVIKHFVVVDRNRDYERSMPVLTHYFSKNFAEQWGDMDNYLQEYYQENKIVHESGGMYQFGEMIFNEKLTRAVVTCAAEVIYRNAGTKFLKENNVKLYTRYALPITFWMVLEDGRWTIDSFTLGDLVELTK